MKRILIALVLLPAALSAQSRARNVILFLADAGGTSTLAAASLHGHGAPRQLFVQSMPHIGLSDTSSAAHIVTDSAAGMTAIVTGHKTMNGVVSLSASTVRGKQDGGRLKTILEYAEEHGLSTGVISNDSLTGATPAATYAHVNDRGQTAAIFTQVFTPQFGDGVDVMIGGGRPAIVKALAADRDRSRRRVAPLRPPDPVGDSGRAGGCVARDRAARVIGLRPRDGRPDRARASSRRTARATS